MTTYEPMLEDAPISGQRYAVLNIVNPHTAQKADQTYVKVKYVCGSLEEAKQYAKRARDNEKYLDVFVAEVGKFLPVSIDPTDIAEQEYSNAVLTELMREHRLERDRADQLFEEYVQENLERNAQQVRDKAVAKDTVTAESVYFKVLQLKAVIAKRNAELDAQMKVLAAFSQEDQDRAATVEYPAFDVLDYTFTQ